ncbi:hypothetical protein ACLKA7_005247 [Drosophila subpalustris]
MELLPPGRILATRRNPRWTICQRSIAPPILRQFHFPSDENLRELPAKVETDKASMPQVILPIPFQPQHPTDIALCRPFLLNQGVKQHSIIE